VVASEVGKLAVSSTTSVRGEIDRAVADMRVHLAQVVDGMTRERAVIDRDTPERRVPSASSEMPGNPCRPGRALPRSGA
jgi:hypothetical protein